jgi:peptide/nickel transport system substrate-binding protein
MSATRKAPALALAAVASLIGAACTGGRTNVVTPTALAPTTNLPSFSPTPTASTPALGGDVTFGAEGWPDCLNPITSCAEDPWTYYTVLEHVLPRAMQLDPKGNFLASPLLVEGPSLSNGDLSESPFTVTFKIRPEAVWEDGSPITSADFDFTWRAMLGTPGAIRTAGYEQIESIDTTDLGTAVIRFKSVYADWADLFGGAFGFILKKAAFPEQIDAERPDLGLAMQTSIPFSGGPFKLQAWSAQEATLVRNDSYFSTEPNFGTVTFVLVGSNPDELMALLLGKVSAMYVEPPALHLIEGAYGLVNLKAVGARGTDYEAIWFDVSTAPLDDPKVRDALMYAIDRQTVIDDLVKQGDPDAKVLNCGFVAIPRVGPWCQTTPFAQFVYDPKKAKSILESDGYDCNDVPCKKDGKPLNVPYSTISTSVLRTSTRALLTPLALRAGFELSISNSSSAHGIGDFPVRMSPDPSITNLLACEAIPTDSNGETGQNFSHWCNPETDRLMKESNAELAPLLRAELLNQVYALEAQDFIGLPLYVVPKISAWRSDQVDGPISTYRASVYGMFFNMSQWYAVG